MELPLISVITVSYNSFPTIERTILSVINQSYFNVEYIIIDGGSTDGTIEVIKKYQDRISYWVSEPDGGIYDAMNKGIELAHGDYIGIINSDDWYSPDALCIIGELINKHKEVDVFCGDLILYYSEQKQILVHSNYKKLKLKMSVNHPTCFVKQSVYKKKMYSLNYRIASDYDLLLWCFKEGCIFYKTNRVLAYFTMNGISSSSSIEGCLEAYQIWQEHIGTFYAIIFFVRDVARKKIGSYMRFLLNLLR